MKNTLLFIDITNILVRLLAVNMKNCLTPKSQKCACDPILVTLLKTRPHYSQSSRENGTPSSGTSPLASYKEVPPPPGSKVLWTALKVFSMHLGGNRRWGLLSFENNNKKRYRAHKFFLTTYSIQLHSRGQILSFS